MGLALCFVHTALQYLSLFSHDTSTAIGWGARPLDAADAFNNASHKVLSVLGAVATVTGFRGAFILIDLTFMTGEKQKYHTRVAEITFPRLRECCRQVEAEVVSNSRKNFTKPGNKTLALYLTRATPRRHSY